MILIMHARTNRIGYDGYLQMKSDVIIIGAGPVGLSFACSLAECDLKVVIIEKLGKDVLSDPPIDGRDIALTHLSIKILGEIGAILLS